jgi:hypothetical protein
MGLQEVVQAEVEDLEEEGEEGEGSILAFL